MNKPNYLSLEQHAKRINETDATIHDNIMLKADYIVSAIEELGEGYAKDLAELIGMNKSTLSRWQSIGVSEIIKTNQSKLPSSFGALYNLTVLAWNSSQRTHFVEGYLCCTVTFRASHLWYSHYSDYQESLHHLIKTMHDSGIGYRRIAYWLNEHGYITPRGHEFKNTHVFSILKKKKVRDERQNKRYELEIGKLSMVLLDTSPE